MKPISASHIEKWNQCKRREAFIYRLGIREPSAKAAQAGTYVHAKLEGVEAPDEWSGYPIKELADKMRLFEPKDIIQREYEFTQAVDGIEFTGRIDGKTATTVLDYKSTSQKKYVKSIASLELDVQRLLYVTVNPEAESTLWLYGVWKDMSVHLREVPVDRKLDTERFKLHVLEPAQEILVLPENVDPLSLPASEGACKLYPPAGCPFRSKCTDLNKPKPASNSMSSLMEKLLSESVPVGQPENQPSDGATPVEDKYVPSSAVPSAGNGASAQQPSPSGEGFPVDFLYIDCIPLRQPELVYSYELLSKVCREVADDAGVPHPLLMDFAKGPPWIALQLEAHLKKNPVKHLYLDTHTAEGRAVVQKLMEICRQPIRSF